MHPDSLTDEKQQLGTWARHGGTVDGTGPGSDRQPWKLLKKQLMLLELQRANPQRAPLQFDKELLFLVTNQLRSIS